MAFRRLFLHLVSRYWPFANGSGRVIDRLGRGVSLGSGERVARTTDGFDITVLADDLIGRHILLSGRFDRQGVDILLDFCEPGDHCLDIGANIGYVACILLQRVADSHVVCVEPQPEIVALLRKNLSRFPADRWSILEAALSDVEAAGFLALNRINRGASSIVTAASDETVTVPMLPASQVLGGLERLDIIKMDIEGQEETVLRSAQEELARLQPRAILYEDKEGKSAGDGPIAKALTAAGYQVFGIRKSLMTTRLEKVTIENAKGFNDFLAVSRTRALPQRARSRHGL